MTEQQIINAVIRMFPIRQHLCVPNVSWGMFSFEVDLVVVTKTGYMYEIEAKSSVADLRRDNKKRRHIWKSDTHIFRKKFFAMPELVWSKVAINGPVPPECGVFVIKEATGAELKWQPHVKYNVCEIRPATIDTQAKPASDSDLYQLARLGTLRYWSLRLKEQEKQP